MVDVRIVVTGGKPAVPNKVIRGSGGSSKPTPYTEDKVNLYTDIENIGAGSSVDKGVVAVSSSEAYSPEKATPVTSIQDKMQRRVNVRGSGGSSQPSPVQEQTNVVEQLSKPQPTVQELYKQTLESKYGKAKDVSSPANITLPQRANTVYSTSRGGISINPQVAERQIKEYEAAQRRKEELSQVQPTSPKKRFEEFTKDKNPITSSIKYAEQRVRGILSKQEEKYTPKGQSVFADVTGERVTEAVDIGTYFIPVIGEVRIIGEVGGQLLTKGGRAETQKTAQILQEKYKVPVVVTKVATPIIGGGLAVLGSKSLIARAVKKLGFPKYESTFIGKEIQREGDNIILRSKILTTEKTSPINQRIYASDVVTNAKILQGESQGLFASETIGATAERTVVMPTGRTGLSKPKPFIATESGIIQDKEVNVLLSKSQGIEVRKPTEGFTFVSIGKSAYKNKEPTVYATIGAGAKVPEQSRTLLYSQSSKVIRNKQGNLEVIKQGQSRSLGIVEASEPSEQLTFFTRGTQTTTQTSNVGILESVQKSAVEKALVGNIKKTNNLVSPILSSSAVQTSSLEESPQITKSAYYGQGTYERSEALLSPMLNQLQKEETKVISKLDVKPILEFKNKVSSRGDQLVQQIESLAQPQLEQQAQREEQRQEQLQREEKIKPTNIPFININIPTPRVVVPKLKNLKLSKKDSILNKVRKAYRVVTFKGGKREVLAERLPEGKAKKLGVSKVLSTLRASFKLEPVGTTSEEDIEYTIPEKFFGISKVEPGRFVQRKTTRFGFRSETKEAQLFRSRKAGKIKWF